jgi:hypothetical protein
MLAMGVNDNVGGLIPSGVPDSIAGMLAPTGGGAHVYAYRARPAAGIFFVRAGLMDPLIVIISGQC